MKGLIMRLVLIIALVQAGNAFNSEDAEKATSSFNQQFGENAEIIDDRYVSSFEILSGNDEKYAEVHAEPLSHESFDLVATDYICIYVFAVLCDNFPEIVNGNLYLPSAIGYDTKILPITRKDIQSIIDAEHANGKEAAIDEAAIVAGGLVRKLYQ